MGTLRFLKKMALKDCPLIQLPIGDENKTYNLKNLKEYCHHCYENPKGEIIMFFKSGSSFELLNVDMDKVLKVSEKDVDNDNTRELINKKTVEVIGSKISFNSISKKQKPQLRKELVEYINKTMSYKDLCSSMKEKEKTSPEFKPYLEEIKLLSSCSKDSKQKKKKKKEDTDSDKS